MTVTDVSRDLDVRYVDGRYWTLTAPFTVQTQTLGEITIAAGFRTNFNSIPRGLWNILPPDDYAKAAVPHDLLYSRHGFDRTPWAGADVRTFAPVTRAQADAVHHELALACGAPAWKARAMYWALRAFGWRVWNDYATGTEDPAKRFDQPAAPPPR